MQAIWKRIVPVQVKFKHAMPKIIVHFERYFCYIGLTNHRIAFARLNGLRSQQSTVDLNKCMVARWKGYQHKFNFR